jgi:versiconal hemiacetal acetate esterase
MEHVLEKAGVKVRSDYYEGYPHYFWIFPSINDSQKFVQNLIEGIRFVLGA